MIARHPIAPPGLRVGLLGGSFDPPHAGHVHISHEALKRLQLDRIWWLVSPGNPLKRRGPAPLPQRMAAARRIVGHPRITVTDIEERLGTRYTAETLAQLTTRYPAVRFVWLMGGDNMASFHHWDRWTRIMETVPIAVFARPGARLHALRSRAALRYAHARVGQPGAATLAQRRAPAWCFVNLPMRDISSTELRARGDKG